MSAKLLSDDVEPSFELDVGVLYASDVTAAQLAVVVAAAMAEMEWYGLNAVSVLQVQAANDGCRSKKEFDECEGTRATSNAVRTARVCDLRTKRSADGRGLDMRRGLSRDMDGKLVVQEALRVEEESRRHDV